MSLREIIDWRIAEADGNLFGTIASDFYQFYDTQGQWVWACDVDIGQDQPLRNVPVANNGRRSIANIGTVIDDQHFPSQRLMPFHNRLQRRRLSCKHRSDNQFKRHL